MKICVIGAGYVGIVTAACFASLGHEVIAIDKNEKKLDKLRQGFSIIYESGLEELIKKGIKKRKLFFSSDIKEGVDRSEIIFICVDTPPKNNG
jgi:UDPglucose 6-dehydrogenase